MGRKMVCAILDAASSSLVFSSGGIHFSRFNHVNPSQAAVVLTRLFVCIVCELVKCVVVDPWKVQICGITTTMEMSWFGRYPGVHSATSLFHEIR